MPIVSTVDTLCIEHMKQISGSLGGQEVPQFVHTLLMCKLVLQSTTVYVVKSHMRAVMGKLTWSGFRIYNLAKMLNYPGEYFFCRNVCPACTLKQIVTDHNVYTLKFFCCKENKNSSLCLILNSKVNHIAMQLQRRVQSWSHCLQGLLSVNQKSETLVVPT